MATATFSERVLAVNAAPLCAEAVRILQVNLGYRCNLTCKHCHVSGGPTRTEVMDERTARSVLAVLLDHPLDTLDLTGGAPELNPSFRRLVAGARKAGRRVIVRSNLSVFLEPGQEDTPEFLRDQGAEVIASLPYYLEDGVDRVRGSGTFAKCIAGLTRLNSLGYGTDSPDLSLGLVYNPQGAFLAPTQATLEDHYREELGSRYGVTFTRLFAFTNMPIGRFREFLVRTGNLAGYLNKLACAFNAGTLGGVMCRQLVSVGWDGRLYDCDFNQVLGLAATPENSRRIEAFDYEALSRREIAVDDHCYGCTAGQGSSCAGAVA